MTTINRITRVIRPNPKTFTLITIVEKLEKFFGKQNWWPLLKDGECLYLEENAVRTKNAAEKWEIMLGAILTQNTSWTNVIRSLAALEKMKLLTWDAVIHCPEDKLALVIRSSGYYHQKAKKIRFLAEFFRDRFDGKVEDLDRLSLSEARKGLLSVWGIGPETADSILLYAYDRLVFVVDAYTRRIFSHLKLIDKTADYEEIRFFIENNLPADVRLYQEAHALFVALGKTFCKPKPVCENCPLSEFCNCSELMTESAH